MPPTPRLAAVVVGTCFAVPARAYDPGAAPVVVQSTTEGIRIDGVLDEPAWARATPAPTMVRYRPTDGPAAGDALDVRVLQDGRSLYLGITLRDADYAPRAHIAPREDINVDDQIGVYLDTAGDARSGYIFYFNALGIQQDVRYSDGQWYFSWNTVLRSKGRLTDDGYVLELEIPFRSLRYPTGGGEQTWGIILTRKVPAWGAKFAHPALDRAHPRTFEQAAPLTGVRPPDRGAGVELIPTLAFVAGADRADATAPLAWQPLDPSEPDFWTDTLRPGLDLRAGLTSNTGLAATLNPDFSQIEADPTQVDLNRRFAFSYAERRPFFLDGLDAFDDSQGLLYTRAIVDPVGGAKVSGHEGRLGLGGLFAVDRDPGASVHERGTPGFDADDSGDDAWASTAYLRSRIDAFGSGHVGLTAADKRILGGTGWNDTGGVDLRVPLGETWTAAGWSNWSAAGDGAQVLLGGDNSVSIERSVSTGWSGRLWAQDITPDHRTEMGFLTQSALTQGTATLAYGMEPAAAWLDTATPSLSVQVVEERNGDGLLFGGPELDTTVAERHSVEFWGGLSRYDESDATVDGWYAGAWYGADVARWLSMSAWADGGRVMDYNTLDPAHSLIAEVEPSIRPSVSTRIDLRLVQQWFLPQDAAASTARAVRAKATWQMSQSLGLRGVGELSQGEDGVHLASAHTSVMMAWLRNPGTEAYLGVNQGWDPDGAGLEDLTVFAKLSWLFRP